MSDGHILYGQAAIPELGDISTQNVTLGNLNDDIHAAMNSLQSIYTGESAQALSASHAQIEGWLLDAQHQLAQLQQAAVEQHETMHQLDASGARSF
jgi:hypothetical protein